MREWLGYYTYTISLSERLQLMNAFLSRGLELYGEREEGALYRFRLPIRDAAAAEDAMRDAEIAFSRGTVGGFCGAARRCGRHPGVLVGVVLSLLLYVLLGGVIWEVRIVGDADVDEDRIRTELAAVGLYEGARVDALDPDRIVTDLLSEDGGIAFATVHLRGVVAEVELIVKDAHGEDPPRMEPCNLVAARDAVVTDLTVYCGEAAVRVGETVAAGDLLVSGVLTDIGGTRLLPASAVVMGRVTDTLEIEVPLVTERQVVTASRLSSLSLTIFGHPWTIGAESGADHTRERRLYLFDRLRLPILVRSGYRVETETSALVRAPSEAEAIAREELKRRLSILLADGALDHCETAVTVTDTALRLSAQVIYETNIAKALAFETQNQ